MDDKTTFARVNDDGLIEVVSEITGEVVAIQSSYKDLIKQKSADLVEHEIDGKTILIEKGISLDRVTQPTTYAFSQTIADIICNRIIEGESLTKVCRDPAMPSFSIVSRWRKMNEDFEQAIKHAYEERAHYYHDRAIETAEATADKDEVPVSKLQIETYKWGAEKGNPGQFSSRPKSDGTAIQAQVVNILTGVPQPSEIDVTPKSEPLPESQGDIVGETDTNTEDAGATASGSGEPAASNDE